MRKVLLVAVSLLVLACGGTVAGVTWLLTRGSVDTVGKVAFDRPLAIPPLAGSHVDGQGRRVFELDARTGTTDFGHGRTPTAGFNGTYLGPTLRATRGERVLINVHNGLAEPTTVHWHGMHLPARMDGGPFQEIAPGGSWSPTWKVDQPAATLWYHPHPHGKTEDQVYQGLAGMFILDDPATGNSALPHEYGVDDVPVIVQDKAFKRNRFDTGHPVLSDIGVLGDTLLVNGTVGPVLEVRTELVRLRLLNGSTARSYNFGFADGRRFSLVGTDGGLLPTPYTMKNIQLSVGERAEIVVAVKAGEELTLRSEPPSLGGDMTHQGEADRFDVLRIRANGTPAPSAAIPDKLVELSRIDPKTAVQHRNLEFSGREINDHNMEMSRVDMVVKKNTVEEWTVQNGHGQPHVFHVHDVQFQVVSVDGAAPPPELSGWKDTVYLPPHVPIRVVMKFADYADPNAAYMYHCHVLFHEDLGMMGQFVVVD
jgi:blue copper oxidase